MTLRTSILQLGINKAIKSNRCCTSKTLFFFLITKTQTQTKQNTKKENPNNKQKTLSPKKTPNKQNSPKKPKHVRQQCKVATQKIVFDLRAKDFWKRLRSTNHRSTYWLFHIGTFYNQEKKTHSKKSKWNTLS